MEGQSEASGGAVVSQLKFSTRMGCKKAFTVAPIRGILQPNQKPSAS